MTMSSLFLLAPLLLGPVLSAPAGQPTELSPDAPIRRAALPFSRIVAFGDDLTDNSEGSYAHNITGVNGANKKLWGFGTWTDGPVAVTYLSQDLSTPISYDYAFGSSGGGGVIGSVCSNALLPAGHLSGHAKLSPGVLVPDAISQISNYTKTGKYNTDIKDTLHFLWTANNDVIASLGSAGRFTICDKDTLCLKSQQTFINQVIGCMNTSLTNLVNAGAEHIIVPNVYPRNLAPWTAQYISNETGMIQNFGNAINNYNTNLEKLISSINTKYSTNIMYYDANGFLRAALKNPSMVQGAAYSYTCVDGCPAQVSNTSSNFNTWYQNTLIHKQPDQWYFMTTVVPSTTVMKALGADMAARVRAHFA